MKFFLFRREPVSRFSDRKSNTGDGLSVFGVPADSLSHITAESGGVNFVFRDAGLYEHSNPESYESIERVRVTVACEVGGEFDFIRNVMEFTAAESKKSVMVFDAVSNFSTFPEALVEAKEQVKVVIPQNPVVLATGDISPTLVPYQAPLVDLAGLTFSSSSNYPLVDYNETTLTALSIGAEVTTWPNSGSGGGAYSITANTEDPLYSISRTNFMATNGVTFESDEMVHPATAIDIEGSFTMYMSITATSSHTYSIFHEDGGQCEGFGDGKTDSKVYFTFDGNTGRPAEARTDTTDHDTVSYRLVDSGIEGVTSANALTGNVQIVYTYIFRRDEKFNIYVHNYKGDVVAFIPAVVGGLATKNFRTDGNLIIDRIGGTTWRGTIARFGVIEKDIGTADAASLAQQLHARYNLYNF